MNIVNLKVISDVKIKIGVDLFGGFGINFWLVIVEKYNLDLMVVNKFVDLIFLFMFLDKDGKICMDCLFFYVMINFIVLKDDYDIGIGNDFDYDCYGIVIFDGLMNLNYFLVVVIDYLLNNCEWLNDVVIGKMFVFSGMIDKVVVCNNCEVKEVLVGFKWFVEGLSKGIFVFGGEESVGVLFLCFDGMVWNIDKDGFILGLLVVEILVVMGKIFL